MVSKKGNMKKGKIENVKGTSHTPSHNKKNTTRSKSESKFEPRILAFCCNWCSYAGADLAGVSRFQYPTNIRIIRVMCSGRIEPNHIFTAFEAGADGVLISGCHPGDCHYISGNLRAEEMVTKLTKVLEIIGFDQRRLRLQWVSASEGQLFAQYIKEFVELITQIGPLNSRKSNVLKSNTDIDSALKKSKGEVVAAERKGQSMGYIKLRPCRLITPIRSFSMVCATNDPCPGQSGG